MAETGLRQMTVALIAGEVTAIEYPWYTAINIMNHTEGELYVSDRNDFAGMGYLSIPAGGGYNEYYPAAENNVATVYLKATSSGNVSLVMIRFRR